MALRLTTKAHGSTRCVGCSKRFADTPGRPTTDVEGIDMVGGRVGTYLPRTEYPVLRRWHTDCLTAREAADAAYRARVEQDRITELLAMAKAAGLPYTEDDVRRMISHRADPKD